MISLLLACLPGSVHTWIRRRVLRQEIAPGARIRFGTLVQVDSLRMGRGAMLGPFTRVRAARLDMGDEARVRPLTNIAARDVVLGKMSQVASAVVISGNYNSDDCVFHLGDHSSIFPFCWIEPGKGVRIGSRVGVGGHGLIFTHGSWANHFLGAPVAFGPVTIEDRVWLPWRVFVMPNVTIGRGAILGAGSVVTKDVEPGVLAAGSPARTVRDRSYAQLDAQGLLERMESARSEILAAEKDLLPGQVVVLGDGDGVDLGPDVRLALASGLPEATASGLVDSGVSVIDLTAERLWLVAGDDLVARVARSLTRLGVRVDVMDREVE
jgi:acetyltransferase-like isoleucine patch superfamily enzyme